MLVAADTLVQSIYPWLTAFALATARGLGMVAVLPVFTRFGLSGLIRSAVAVAVAVPMLFPAYAAITAGDAPATARLAAIVVKEIAVGVVVGVVLGVPFWAADVAGEIVDLQRGSTMAQLLDPASIGESSISSTLLTLAIVTLFFTTGGFVVLLGAFYRSYELWPLLGFAPLVGPEGALFFLRLLDAVLRIGLMMVAPLVIAILIADFMLAYLARISPQLHVFDLSLAVKNLLFAFLIVLYVAFLAPLMLQHLDLVRDASEALGPLAAGGGGGGQAP